MARQPQSMNMEPTIQLSAISPLPAPIWFGVLSLLIVFIAWCRPGMFQGRYFALHALLVLNKVKIVCCSAHLRLALEAEIFQVSSQLAIGRLQLRYVLLKRFVHKRFCSGCRRCAPNK